MDNEQVFWILAAAVLPVSLLAAAVIDQRERRIPNALTGALVVTGLLANVLSGGWSGLGWAVAGMLLGGALLIIPWQMGSMGGGDVKLLAGVGAWLGPKLVFFSLLGGAVIGGLVGGMMLAAKVKKSVPYAVALAGGTLVVLGGRLLGWEVMLP